MKPTLPLAAISICAALLVPQFETAHSMIAVHASDDSVVGSAYTESPIWLGHPLAIVDELGVTIPEGPGYRSCWVASGDIASLESVLESLPSDAWTTGRYVTVDTRIRANLEDGTRALENSSQLLDVLSRLGIRALSLIYC